MGEIRLWKCITCKTTLGHVEDKKILRIKRKDVYIEVDIISGEVKISYNCCRCGFRNVLKSDEKGGEEK